MDIDSEDPVIENLMEELLAEIDDRVLSIQLTLSLKFLVPPSMSPSLAVGDSSTFSSGRLALDLREPCNQRFLNTEARLIEIISQMGDKR